MERVTAWLQVVRAARASRDGETSKPPHLRGPIIRAYADTNGMPPDEPPSAGESSKEAG
jgi:hypothetical protein